MNTAGNSSENVSMPGVAPQQNPVHQLEQLHGRVAELERELAASRAKCEEYRQFVLQWVSAQHSPEELRRFALDDDETGFQPLSQFVGELEAMLCARKKGA
jgi:hypothetical protein